MKKKILCGILALGLVLMPMGDLGPTLTVCASESHSEYHIKRYATGYYNATTENTLFFTDITKPESCITIPKGTVLTIRGELFFGTDSTTFRYVLYNGIEGYVDSRYINEWDSIKFECYTKEACDIYGFDKKEVFITYPKNTKLIVNGEMDGWTQLEYDGCIVFAKSELLTERTLAPVQEDDIAPEFRAMRDRLREGKTPLKMFEPEPIEPPTEEEMRALIELCKRVVVY